MLVVSDRAVGGGWGGAALASETDDGVVVGRPGAGPMDVVDQHLALGPVDLQGRWFEGGEQGAAAELGRLGCSR